jgi:nucleotide-binding universal stress UspA family protein
MKTILVPIDFSDNSKNAMDYAILLANQLNMKLLLLHAFDASVAEVISDSYKVVAQIPIKGTPKDNERELKVWREAVVTSEEELECNTLFTKESLEDSIDTLVKTGSVHLIVMGTKGATGLKEIFIGSNTARIIEKIPCPVIAVPDKYQFNSIKKIIFATDYHDSDIASIRFLIKLAKAADSELAIIHLADGELKLRYEEDLLEHFMERVKKSIVYDKVKFYLLNGVDIVESLTDFIADQNADLFAISSERRLLIGPFFNRSLTRKFVQHIQIPLLAFHASDNDDTDLF